MELEVNPMGRGKSEATVLLEDGVGIGCARFCYSFIDKHI